MNKAWENAIRCGDVQIVLDLIERGADLNGLDRYGQTALMLAAHAGHRELVEILIARRADLNVTAKFGLSALMLAIVAGHADIARLLAEAGADLSLRGTGAPVFAGRTAHDLVLAHDLPGLATALQPKT